MSKAIGKLYENDLHIIRQLSNEIDRLRTGILRAAESCTDPVCKRHLNELLKGEAT